MSLLSSSLSRLIPSSVSYIASSKRMMSSSSWSRLVRFHPRSSPTTVLVGEPVESDLDVGLSTYEGRDVEVKVFSGSSAISPGSDTGKVEVVERLLSPISRAEVGTIRCIGLNVSNFLDYKAFRDLMN